MDIIDYLNLVKKNIALILSSIVIFVAIALLLTWKTPVTYQSSSALEITRTPLQTQSNVEYFQYDNFYNTQVATTFANNAIGLIGAPSVVAETYQKAGYEIPPSNLRDLGKTFAAKKKTDGSSVVDVNYSSKDKTKAQTMIASLSSIIKEKIESNNAKDTSARFTVNVTNPVIIATPKMYTLNAIVAGIFGLFISISYALIANSIKKAKR